MSAGMRRDANVSARVCALSPTAMTVIDIKSPDRGACVPVDVGLKSGVVFAAFLA